MENSRRVNVDKSKITATRVRTIFRSFAGVILGIGLLTFIFSYGSPARDEYADTQIVHLVAFCLLFLYLSSGKLEYWLGRLYLPLALGSTTIILLVNERIVQKQFLSISQTHDPAIAALGNGILISMGDSWVIFLFMPLVLIAWQYRFRSVMAFVIGTALLDMFLILKIFGTEQDYLIVMFNTIGSRSIAFIVVGLIVVRLVTHQQQQQDQLTAANQKLSNYANILEKFSVNVEQLATSYERNRLARELHDTLAHTLSALSVQLEATDTVWNTKPEQAQALLKNALSTTRSGLMETRRALQALRASPLEDLGLALALSSLAESAAQRENFLIDIDISAHLSDLSPQIEQTIYRVVQESLENICRHANARHVSLSVQRAENAITVLVTDDGIGFNLSAVDHDRKLGLRGMRERAEMLGGDLSVQCAPGKGTTVKLVIYEAVS